MCSLHSCMKETRFLDYKRSLITEILQLSGFNGVFFHLNQKLEMGWKKGAYKVMREKWNLLDVDYTSFLVAPIPWIFNIF